MFQTRFRITAVLLFLAGVLALNAVLISQPVADRPSSLVAAEPAKPVVGPNARQDVFGYSAAFDEELAKIGQMSPQEFARRYPAPTTYLPRFGWDPTTAKFWDDFNRAPDRTTSPRGGRDDFRLNADELKVFKQNGFIVSERLGAGSFGEMFFRIYSRDLPVFVSADALLHAWHRSYDAMLEELEETYLAESLDEILAGMAEGLPEARRQTGQGVLAESVTDADYFLAVARSLLAGKPVATRFNQDERVSETLRACASLQLIEDYLLLGRPRDMDFSQFKVRGHYENSELLKRYFRAMMWCGRIDLRIAGGKDGYPGSPSSPRELGAAVVLHDLLQRSGRFEQWQQFDRLIQTFVGKTDSMTFAQLGGLLAKVDIKSPADVKDLDTLSAIQADILAGKLGLQQIRGDVYLSPFGPEKLELPRSFTVLGQKFALDSWVTSKVVFDDIRWGATKVQRRVPSCLDVAFAAFGNDQVVPELVARMENKAGREFRDGLNYQHNLAAVRNVIDRQDRAAWGENLYMHWLGCLRELSEPTTAAQYPEVMRTRAWAMKSLNTQLASWAQLRHDTILYVKQSYTAKGKCFYPAGYVEPRPRFWARLEQMAQKSAELIEQTPFPDRTVERQYPRDGLDDSRPLKWTNRGTILVNLKETQKYQAAFLRNFARQVTVLKEIAAKELAQKEFTADEKQFLEDVIQINRGSGFTRYDGWYPGLFYKGRPDSGKWDALVADVHTDVPSYPPGDPGCVLHQGVGNVDLLLIAIDNGKDRMVYAGPVLSHYEFEMPGVTRKADSDWRKDLAEGKQPPRPEWTRSYLVPGVNPQAKTYPTRRD